MIPEVLHYTPDMRCGNGWHISQGNKKRCRCGMVSNPAHRSFWQRVKDRRAFKRMQRGK